MTEAVALTFTVDDSQVVHLYQHVEEALANLIELAAEDLAHEAAAHAPGTLGEPWNVTGSGPTERGVTAPHFWAHFLDRGTLAHGPKSAAHLVFTVNGETIFADLVGGVAGRGFEEQAIAQTSGHLPEILSRLIAEGA